VNNFQSYHYKTIGLMINYNEKNFIITLLYFIFINYRYIPFFIQGIFHGVEEVKFQVVLRHVGIPPQAFTLTVLEDKQASLR